MQKEKTAKTESRLTNNPIAAFIKRNGGIIIGLLILCVVVQINTPKFLTWNNIVGVLRQISTNLYVACAITMILIAGGHRRDLPLRCGGVCLHQDRWRPAE